MWVGVDNKDNELDPLLTSTDASRASKSTPSDGTSSHPLKYSLLAASLIYVIRLVVLNLETHTDITQL